MFGARYREHVQPRQRGQGELSTRQRQPHRTYGRAAIHAINITAACVSLKRANAAAAALAAAAAETNMEREWTSTLNYTRLNQRRSLAVLSSAAS